MPPARHSGHAAAGALPRCRRLFTYFKQPAAASTPAPMRAQQNKVGTPSRSPPFLHAIIHHFDAAAMPREKAPPRQEFTVAGLPTISHQTLFSPWFCSIFYYQRRVLMSASPITTKMLQNIVVAQRRSQSRLLFTSGKFVSLFGLSPTQAMPPADGLAHHIIASPRPMQCLLHITRIESAIK